MPAPKVRDEADRPGGEQVGEDGRVRAGVLIPCRCVVVLTGLTASPGDDSTGSSALRTADDANAVVRQQRLAVLHEEIAAAEAALGDLWQQQKAAATGSAALAQLRRDWLTVVCQLQLDLATAGAADVALEQEVAAAQALFEALSEQQERAGATADAIYDAAQAAAEHLLQLREEAAAEAAAAEAAAEQHHHQQQQSVEMAASITTSFPPMDDGDTTAKLLVEEHHHDERRQAATLVDGANGDCTMGEAHEQAEHGQVAAGVDQGEAGEDGMTSLVPTTTTSAHNIVASGAASTAEAEAALVTVIAGYDANADTLDSSPVEAAGLVAATAIKCPGDGSNVVATSQSPVAESVEAADLRVPATDCITTNTTTASASQVVLPDPCPAVLRIGPCMGHASHSFSRVMVPCFLRLDQESRRASDAAPPASSAGAPSSAELAAALQAALDINRELNTAIEKLTDENSALVQQNEVLEKALRAAQAALREVATKGVSCMPAQVCDSHAYVYACRRSP